MWWCVCVLLNFVHPLSPRVDWLAGYVVLAYPCCYTRSFSDAHFQHTHPACSAAPDNKQLHLMSFFYEKTKAIGAGTTGKELDENEDESSLTKLKKHASVVCSLSEAQLVRRLVRVSARASSSIAVVVPCYTNRTVTWIHVRACVYLCVYGICVRSRWRFFFFFFFFFLTEKRPRCARHGGRRLAVHVPGCDVHVLVFGRRPRRQPGHEVRDGEKDPLG